MSKISYIKTTDVSRQHDINYKCAFKGAVAAVLADLIIMIAFAFIITYSALEIEYAPFVARLIFYFGGLLAGLFSGLGKKNYGWMLGLFSGLIYTLGILTFGALITGKFNFSFSLVGLIIFTIFLAVVGGIVGINIKIKKKKR